MQNTCLNEDKTNKMNRGKIVEWSNPMVIIWISEKFDDKWWYNCVSGIQITLAQWSLWECAWTFRKSQQSRPAFVNSTLYTRYLFWMLVQSARIEPTLWWSAADEPCCKLCRIPILDSTTWRCWFFYQMLGNALRTTTWTRLQRQSKQWTEGISLDFCWNWRCGLMLAQ